MAAAAAFSNETTKEKGRTTSTDIRGSSGSCCNSGRAVVATGLPISALQAIVAVAAAAEVAAPAALQK
jgi:hypothetical protein